MSSHSSRSSRHSGRSGRGSGSSSSGRSSASAATRQIIDSLVTHRVNTLTELCRIERMAATASEDDQIAFQQPMTAAWSYYVTSNQMLSELRGLTPNYPFCGDIVSYAQMLVQNDPDANRSWNFAWLVLRKIEDENLISSYAESEASRPEMWAGTYPDDEQVAQLAACFEHEWSSAVGRMLSHWQGSPTWY
ncbi:hypothetical protein QBC35DRAFT_392840 [Podospora australis]|uniref:Uncharacterized protein n=1 Tax=Podospora australis TaxID=1536484 RepID=A0AAN6WL87_9PEZI|nr:hypothetical protein QBC35DRAFT_392840 [Podospora australis]